MSVDIFLLGRFDVRVDGREIPTSAWSRRSAASLVKVLALAPRRQLHREQVLDALWPDVAPAEAMPRLHKAAHFARRALGPDSVVLRQENVLLFPDRPVTVDADRFEQWPVTRSTAVMPSRPRRPPTGTAGSCCRTTATRRGRRRPGTGCTCCSCGCCARPAAGPSWSRPIRPTSEAHLS